MERRYCLAQQLQYISAAEILSYGNWLYGADDC